VINPLSVRSKLRTPSLALNAFIALYRSLKHRDIDAWGRDCFQQTNNALPPLKLRQRLAGIFACFPFGVEVCETPVKQLSLPP